jgi:hypothetical protein
MRDCIPALMQTGITYDHAVALRRISMTLHRWHELECGDGNNYGSWAIERGGGGDEYAPYLVHHHYGMTWKDGTRSKDTVTRTRLPDREKGALKRLAVIMAYYDGLCGRPILHAYVQTDPRGSSLYIIRPGDVPKGENVESYYNRGLPVYK